MAFNNPPTKTENYTFGRGVLFFAPFDDLGFPMGERDLGNTPGFTLNVETENYTHKSSRSGISKTDLSKAISTEFNASITVEDMSAENQALFVAGTVLERAQAATPVTGEVIRNIETDRQYQLGATALNPTGVRGVTGVTLALQGASTAPVIAISTAYGLGTLVRSASNLFVVSQAGTTAASAPAYSTTSIGAETTDGTAKVRYLGSTAAFVADTDYTVSPEAGRITILPTGAIAEAYDALPRNADGKKVGLFALVAAYTPLANSRTQIVSSGKSSVNGQLRFVADNATGDNRDLFIASVSLGANGELAFITGDEIGSFELTAGVNERDSTTPQIIIDGRPI